MTVKELIKKLGSFDGDSVVTVGESCGGWTNIEKIEQDGSSVKIIMDVEQLFTDE